MREKKGGALQKLKKRLSHSFGRLSKFFFLQNLYLYYYYEIATKIILNSRKLFSLSQYNCTSLWLIFCSVEICKCLHHKLCLRFLNCRLLYTLILCSMYEYIIVIEFWRNRTDALSVASRPPTHT